ncbi:MAG TPA: hypothetical protein VGE31_03425 [Candidatus Paceibacterota bacterium]
MLDLAAYRESLKKQTDSELERTLRTLAERAVTDEERSLLSAVQDEFAERVAA